MKLSCCMVLKDEAETIDAALRSVLGVVDEFVIGIDSATTDQTKAIIAKTVNGSTIKPDIILYDFNWNGDFSKIRNEGIEKATGDWIIILDGHEMMRPDSAACILETIDGVGNKIDQIHARLYHRPDEYGNPSDYNYQARLIRRSSGLRYKHAQHNMIPMEDQTRAAGAPHLIIDHRQPEGRKLARRKQNRETRPGYFRALIAEDPKHWWGRYYLGVALKDEGKHEEAMAEWRTIVDEAPATAPRWLLALICVCEGLVEDGKSEGAITLCKKAWPAYLDRREPYILLGQAEKARGNAGEAIRWLNIAAHMPEPFLPHMTLIGQAYTWLPFKELAEAYMMLGNLEAAGACAERALQFRPGDAALLSIANSIRLSIRERCDGRRVKVVAVVDKIRTFGKEIVAALQEHNRVHQVAFPERYVGPIGDRSDVVFVEWCDQNAISASRDASIKRLVIRLHTYEAYSAMPGAVDWTNVDAIIYPAEHVYRLTNERFKLDSYERLEQYVIHNPIFVDQFALVENPRNKSVAWLGYINWKKGVPLLFQVARHNPDYQFFVGGKFQDWDSRRYFETKKPENVTFDGWIDNVPGWFADKTYVMNTSLREGLGNGPLQGMATGLKPIIHAWPGAHEGYPPDSIFELATDVRAMLEGPIKPEKYREWVVTRHDAEHQLRKLTSVILGEGTDADDCLK